MASLVWDLSRGICCLKTFARDTSLGGLRLGSTRIPRKMVVRHRVHKRPACKGGDRKAGAPSSYMVVKKTIKVGEGGKGEGGEGAGEGAGE